MRLRTGRFSESACGGRLRDDRRVSDRVVAFELYMMEYCTLSIMQTEYNTPRARHRTYPKLSNMKQVSFRSITGERKI